MFTMKAEKSLSDLHITHLQVSVLYPASSLHPPLVISLNIVYILCLLMLLVWNILFMAYLYAMVKIKITN